MSQYTSYYLYEKYEKRDDGQWVPVYPNTYHITGEGTMPLVIKKQNDEVCGYVPKERIYRWVNMDISTDYMCDECEAITQLAKLTLNDASIINIGDDGNHILQRNMLSRYGSRTEHAEILTACTEIGENAFGYNTVLSSVAISNSVTSIGNYAFQYCSAMTSVSIGNSVTSIGEFAFENCRGLTSVTIPDSVISIGVDAFRQCRGLVSVILSTGITKIEDDIFQLCTSLQSIDIPNSVTSIGGGAFMQCTGLTSVTIPSRVTSIGGQAFDDCRSLTSVTIPSRVTSIGDYAFRGCSGLASITCKATTPPTLGSDAFKYTNDAPIYVPSASVNRYKSTSGWSTYASRIRAINS